MKNLADKTVLIEKRGGVARVTLNRPDARNAFHPDMIESLREAFAGDLAKDASLRAVCLQGAGESFCAGADIGWMRSTAAMTPEENRQDADRLYAMLLAAASVPRATGRAVAWPCDGRSAWLGGLLRHRVRRRRHEIRV